MHKALPPAELKRIREAMGHSQVAFAALLGVTEVTVWRWENGVTKVPPTAQRLVRVLFENEPVTVSA